MKGVDLPVFTLLKAVKIQVYLTCYDISRHGSFSLIIMKLTKVVERVNISKAIKFC